MQAGRRITIAVVDDHPAIALAIRAAIDAEAGADDTLEVVGTARSIDGARELLGGLPRPDVVLCDIQLRAGLDGLEVVELAVAAGAKAIVLTSFDRAALMRAAFESSRVSAPRALTQAMAE